MRNSKAKAIRKNAKNKVANLPWILYKEITYHRISVTDSKLYLIDPITMDYCGRKLYKDSKKMVKNESKYRGYCIT